MAIDRCASCSFLTDNPEPEDTFFYERQLIAQGLSPVAGVDEAGRGPLAGPVVAGCVVLPGDCEHHLFKDSKKLSSSKREELYDFLRTSLIPVGVGISSVEEIDKINILQASLLAMKRAVVDCAAIFSCQARFLLVDGTFSVPMQLPQQALTKGESKSASIAAASIIAKVTRDRLMAQYHIQYPQFNFIQHKGYPTKAHREAIAKYGPSSLHRKTFKGVREYDENFSIQTNKKQTTLW